MIRRLTNTYHVLVGKIDLDKVTEMMREALDQRDRSMAHADHIFEQLLQARDGIKDLKEQLKYARKPLILRDITNACEAVGITLTNGAAVTILRSLLDPESRRRAESDRLADEAIAKMKGPTQ